MSKFLDGLKTMGEGIAESFGTAKDAVKKTVEPHADNILKVSGEKFDALKQQVEQTADQVQANPKLRDLVSRVSRWNKK